jgi:hypothetical protein
MHAAAGRTSIGRAKGEKKLKFVIDGITKPKLAERFPMAEITICDGSKP